MSSTAFEASNNASQPPPQRPGPSSTPRRHTATDFIFSQFIGEGSFSMVFKAHCATDPRKVFAIKTCPKDLIQREKKVNAIHREKQVMSTLSRNPYFIRLYSTFHDSKMLFFVLSYAKHGELLKYIPREGLDVAVARFYAGEILMALEYLHNRKIVHRDIKPENILLSHDMHIKISDFGSCRTGDNPNCPSDQASTSERQSLFHRRQSFVGTAQYVSPEMLGGNKSPPACDIWAWGCTLYQMLTGTLPFKGDCELILFRKILQDPPDYHMPSSIDPDARSLIPQILVHEPNARLGVQQFNDMPEGQGEYTGIREHAFFQPLAGRWDTLHSEAAPLSIPDSEEEDVSWMNLRPGLDEQQMAKLLLREEEVEIEPSAIAALDLLDTSDPEFQRRLQNQRNNNEYHQFVENNLIIRQGIIHKKVGLSTKTRMFLLTTGPKLYYVDPANKVLKGQVPLSAELKAITKSFRFFNLETPNRTYYLEDRTQNAEKWVAMIEGVRSRYFPPQVNTQNKPAS